MRHLNVNKEYDGTDVYADDFIEKLDSEQGTTANETKKKTNKEVIRFETLPVPSMEEKMHIREKIFSLLEESRMNEMRLELEYDLAKVNNDEEKIEELSEQLYIIQKTNSEKLKNVLKEYQPQHVSKQWGNDPDYVAMLKQMSAIGSNNNNKKSKNKSVSKMEN